MERSCVSRNSVMEGLYIHQEACLWDLRTSNGMCQAGLNVHSNHLQSRTLILTLCLQNKKCSIRDYLISCNRISKSHHRLCAVVGSLEGEVGYEGRYGSSTLDPNIQRFKSADGMSDFETQLEDLFNEVKTMVALGNEDEAIDLLQANYVSVKEKMESGTKGIKEAAILDVIALGFTVIGDFKMVGSLLDKLDELLEVLKDDEPVLDLILIHMGSMYSSLGKSERAILVYERGLRILENTYGNGSSFLITPLLGLAKTLASVGKATKAIEIYHRSISILESNRGGENENLAVPLFALGNLLIREGKIADAEDHFMRILHIYKELYGETDGRVGMAMCSLAYVKCGKGDIEEAIQLYRNALHTIKESNYMAPDNSILEKMRIDLAELLHAVGRGKEGREVLEECLLITGKYKGKDHPNFVTHLSNLAASYSRSKNFVEAERLLRSSLQILEKTVEPDDQAITFPKLELAVTLYHLQRDEEAEELALEVLKIREKAFGKESLPVGEALDCLVAIQSRLEEDDDEVLNHLKRIFRIQEREFGNDSEQVVTTLKKIVHYVDKLGRKDEKLPLQRRLSMLRMKQKQMRQQ